jgi:hypothetical protein
MHAPKVFVVFIIGSFFMEYNKSETLQLGRGVNHDGRSMKTGINAICSGVTARFIAIAIVVIAGLNEEDIATEHMNKVANVDIAGMGNTPPQNPEPNARPICEPERDFAGVTSLSLNHNLTADISRSCLRKKWNIW